MTERGATALAEPPTGALLAADQRLGGRLQAVLDEAAAALLRVGRSPAVTAGQDVSCSLVDAHGALLGARVHHVHHLAEAATAGRELLRDFAFDLADGDVLLVADPRFGSSRAASVSLGRPLFHRTRLAGMLVVRFGLGDLGGNAPGTFEPSATSVWAEGLVLPPVKLVDGGQTAADLVDLLVLNSREPERTRWDLTVALTVGGQALARLQALWSDETAAAAGRAVRRNGQVLERAIAGWDRVPEGRADVRVRLADGQIALGATVARADGGLRFDFGGSDDERGDALNCSRIAAHGAVLAAVRAAVPGPVAIDQALLDAVTLSTRSGSILDPRWPHARSSGSLLLGPAVQSCAARALAALTGVAAPATPTVPLVGLSTPPPGATTVVAPESPLTSASAEELERGQAVAVERRTLDEDGTATVTLRNRGRALLVRTAGRTGDDPTVPPRLADDATLTVEIGDLTR